MSDITEALAEFVSLDRERLDSMGDLLGKEVMAEIIDIYKKDAAEKVAIIEQAIEKNDAGSVHINCHSLKSASGNVALDRMAELARCMEDLAKQGDLGLIRPWFEEMQREFEKIQTLV